VYNGGCRSVLTCQAEESQSPMYMSTWLLERCWSPVHVMSWSLEERLSPVVMGACGVPSLLVLPGRARWDAGLVPRSLS
jgi:hypothetical protein